MLGFEAYGFVVNVSNIEGGIDFNWYCLMQNREELQHEHELM